MPITAELHDGRRLEFPDGTDPAVIQATVKRLLEPTTKNADLAGAAGLTTRAMVKGALALPAMGADAIGGLANFAQDKLIGEGRGIRFQQTMPTLDSMMDKIGIAAPDTPMQRIVSQGVEIGSGAGIAAKGAEKLASGATGVAKDVLARFAESPMTQAITGAGSGLAGQQSKESGAGFGGQLVSSVLGGVAAGGIAQGAQNVAKNVINRLNFKPGDVEAKIVAILQNQGIDPATITPAMKSALMDDVKSALKIGSLDDAALARLADYRRLGLTPTRGRLTLDPYAVTQEQNAMKLAAATGARDAKLPAIAQQNNQTLLSKIEDFAPNPDDYGMGARAMGPVLGKDASMEANRSALYEKARTMAGGDVPLERGVIQRIYEALNAENRLGNVPADIMGKLNSISKGVIENDGQKFEVPWNVKTLDGLMSDIADAQRRATGREKGALSIIRKVLDSDAVTPDKKVFGGSQVVNQATAANMVAQDFGPAALLAKLNEARAANAKWRNWQESAPGIEAAVNGAAADTFIKKYILSESAGLNDVARLAADIKANPAASDAVRSAIVQKLKESAIGRGNGTDTANFSGRQWMSALDQIGERKLKLFFSPEEVEQLKSIGRVGSIETFQPRGSAVNNSNTAAGAANLVQGIAKRLKPFADKVPFGQAAVSVPADSITLSLLQRGATNVPQSIVLKQPPKGLIADPYVLPAIVGAGLLSP